MTSDRRVKYTKAALEEALLDLMAEKPIDRISVKELCDKADVNRSTFYAHYGSPQELLDSITGALINEFTAIKDSYTTVEEMIRDSIAKLNQNAKLFRALFNTREGVFGYSLKLLYTWEDVFIKSMEHDGVPTDTAKLLYSYIATGSAAAIGLQTVGAVKMSVDETVSHIKTITDAIIETYKRRQ